MSNQITHSPATSSALTLAASSPAAPRSPGDARPRPATPSGRGRASSKVESSRKKKNPRTYREANADAIAAGDALIRQFRASSAAGMNKPLPAGETLPRPVPAPGGAAQLEPIDLPRFLLRCAS